MEKHLRENTYNVCPDTYKDVTTRNKQNQDNRKGFLEKASNLPLSLECDSTLDYGNIANIPKCSKNGFRGFKNRWSKNGLKMVSEGFKTDA